MFKKILFLSIATFVVFYIFLVAGSSQKTPTSKENPQVRGAKINLASNEETQEESTSDQIKKMLIAIAKAYNSEKINIYDTSFKWGEEGSQDLLGYGLIISNENNSWPLKNILVQNRLSRVDYFISSTVGYANSEVACVLKESIYNDKNLQDSIEVRCAVLNISK